MKGTHNGYTVLGVAGQWYAEMTESTLASKLWLTGVSVVFVWTCRCEHVSM
jgi:hypothetical protein